MHLRYDENFVEGAVFRRASRRPGGPPPLQVLRFNAAREKLYAILDPDARNAAFFDLHLACFREWDLEQALLRPVDEFPRLRDALAVLAFRRARTPRDEGAELFVNAQCDRNGVVGLRVERLDQTDELTYLLRHEFAHLDDMLDPAFGYSPEPPLPDANPGQQRLARERYRLLWAISIDSRLAASARAPAGSRERHWAAFDRAFSFWPPARRDEVFDSLWRGRQPRHNELLALAANPRGLAPASGPASGAPCPLCGFTTFAWADSSVLAAATGAAIRAEFPAWTVAQGACRRCAEIYRVASARAPLSA